MIPALAAVVLLLGERLPRLRVRALPIFRAHLGSDVVYLLTGFVAGGALALAWVAHSATWMAMRVDLGWTRLPWIVQVAAAIVALDLGNYAAHWALHRFDALWRIHEVHHSSLELDWMATFRSHLLEQALRRVVAPLGLVVLGMPVDAIAPAAAIFVAWAMTNHANLRLPLAWAEGVLVTPRLHRLHHVPATSEQNLGTVFSLWDRLLGRLVVREAPPDALLGLPRHRTTYPQTWGRQLVAPLRDTTPGRVAVA